MFNYLYGFIYVILTGLSMVLIHDAGYVLSPALNLLFMSIVAIIFFHLLNVRHLKKMYITAFKEKWLWLKIMLVVAAMWVATIYGPVYVSPNIFILNYFALLSILGMVCTIGKAYDVYLLLSAVGVAICTIILTVSFLHASVVTGEIILGISLGLLGGVLAYLHGLYSHIFAIRTNLSATQVIALRFWLVEFACLPLIPLSSLSTLHTDHIVLIVTLAFASLILPIYFVMKSILALGPEKNAIVCGLVPLATYIIQAISFQELDFTALSLNLLSGFFIGLPYIAWLIKRRVHHVV